MKPTELLPVGAPRNEWLAVRKTGLGGSDAGVLMGDSPYTTITELWADKTGRTPEKEMNAAMRAGTLLEPVVRQMFQDETGLEVAASGTLQHHSIPILHYNPDGLIESDKSVFEAKTAGAHNAAAWDDGPIKTCWWQVQQGMLVTGRDLAHVAVLIGGQEFRSWEVRRDDFAMAALIARAVWFWEFVESDTMPPLDPRAASEAELNLRFPDVSPALEKPADPEALMLVRELAGVGKQRLTLSKREAVLKTELRARMGDAEFLVDRNGVRVARHEVRKSKRFSTADFKKANPAEAKEYMRETETHYVTALEGTDNG